MHFYLAHLPEHNEAELAALNEFRDDKGWFIGAGAGAIPGLAFFRRMANKTPPKPILGGVVGATTIMLGSWLGGGYTNTFGTQEKIKTAIQNGEWERKFPEGPFKYFMLSSFTGIVPDRTQYEILLAQRGIQLDPAVFEQVLNPPKN